MIRAWREHEDVDTRQDGVDRRNPARKALGMVYLAVLVLVSAAVATLHRHAARLLTPAGRERGGLLVLVLWAGASFLAGRSQAFDLPFWVIVASAVVAFIAAAMNLRGFRPRDQTVMTESTLLLSGGWLIAVTAFAVGRSSVGQGKTLAIAYFGALAVITAACAIESWWNARDGVETDD